jgi:ribosome biogenesis protein ERB1
VCALKVSCLAVHPSGDHVLVGSYDRRVVWFDLDRGGMPFKTLKYHTHALRSVGFHRAYPLMATASDDGTVHVFHATVYSDLSKDPLLVPVKQLVHRAKDRAHGSGATNKAALALAFHPTQPWLFSAGSDHNVVLFQDL